MKKINTEFFRNPEIKRDIYIYGIVSMIGFFSGFIIDLSVGFLILGFCILFAGLHFISTYHRYEKISVISQNIDRILHGQANVSFDDYKEGELAILQSEIRKMILRLKEQADALTSDKIYLTDSIADISHQLKTPLTSINLLLSFLEKSELTVEQRQGYVKEVKRLINRIEWLITTLLKLSKIDAGTAYFKKERVSMRELIRLSIEPIAIPMELKEQELRVTLEGDITFTGDLAWSVEAVSNIVKNCMEHTPQGGRISISSTDNSIFTEIVIEDNGSGIAAEDLPHIFERFYKGRYSGKQSIGIGLALARRIITEQNGTIKAENKKEGGARFTLHFYKLVY
jgi:signal transduction histidine kinase